MAPKRAAGEGHKGLAVGSELPDIPALEAEDGSTKVDLKEKVKESGVVLVYFCKANTGGCKTQLQGFKDNYEKIKAAGYEVYGISADKPKAQSNFKKKLELPFHLLCDPSTEALQKLGVLKGDKKIARSHVVVEKESGKIVDAHYDVTPKESVKQAVKFTTGEEPPAASRAKKEKAEPKEKKPRGGKKKAAKEEEEEEEHEEEEEEEEEEKPPAKKARGGSRGKAKKEEPAEEEEEAEGGDDGDEGGDNDDDDDDDDEGEEEAPKKKAKK